MSPAAASTTKVAQRLCALCREGKFDEAMAELYADNARHVEPMEFPGSPYKKVMEGKATLQKMSEHFRKVTTVHSCTIGTPNINEDQFIVEMTMDCTTSEGPMAGQRHAMSEHCLYTVRDGKIVEAKFFFGGCGEV